MFVLFYSYEKIGPKRISIRTNNNIVYSFGPNGQTGWSGSGRNRTVRMTTRGLGLEACKQTDIYTYQKVSTMAEALTNQNDLKTDPGLASLLATVGQDNGTESCQPGQRWKLPMN